MGKRNLSGRGVLVGAVVAALVAIGVTAVAETAASGGLTVTEMQTASQMEGGVPAAAVTEFQRGRDMIYCFMRIENSTRAETAVYVRFEPATGAPASTTGGIRLRVPASPRYRTFARTGAGMPAGSYRCVARDEGGAVLRSADFTITE